MYAIHLIKRILFNLLIGIVFFMGHHAHAKDILADVMAVEVDNQATIPRTLTASTQALIDLLTRYQSMQADFTQIVYDSDDALLQKTTGSLSLKKPNRMVWQSQPPYAQTIVTDGLTLWIYDPDFEQVTIRSLDEYYHNSPAILFSGDLNNLAERFLVVANPLTTELIDAQFTLYAKDPDNLYERIELGFKDDLISQMDISDTLGQKIRIIFSNQVLNPTLADDFFTFIPPANTDIIRQ